MHPTEAPLAMLDEAAIAAAELRHDPYDFAFVEHAIARAAEGRGAGATRRAFPTAAATACPTCATARASARWSATC